MEKSGFAVLGEVAFGKLRHKLTHLFVRAQPDKMHARKLLSLVKQSAIPCSVAPVAGDTPQYDRIMPKHFRKRFFVVAVWPDLALCPGPGDTPSQNLPEGQKER